MPIIHLKMTKQLSQETQNTLAAELTKTTETILKKKSEVTAICIEYILPLNWYINNKTVHETTLSTFYLDIKVSEGTNTKDDKRMYVEAVFNLMKAYLGSLHGVSYVYIEEVKADAYGYMGQTQEFRYIENLAKS
jgi:4-oxalocrotonate tautomerase